MDVLREAAKRINIAEEKLDEYGLVAQSAENDYIWLDEKKKMNDYVFPKLAEIRLGLKPQEIHIQLPGLSST